MNQTEADFSPNIKKSILKAHAISWVDYYPKILIKDEETSKVVDEIIRIQRIVLYRAGSIDQIGVKYVIVFELPEIPEKYKEPVKSGLSTAEQRQVYIDRKQSSVWYSDVLEQMIDFPDGPPFVGKEFYNKVYNKQPDGNSWKEWLFKWIRPGEVLGADVIEGSKMVLFQDTCKQGKETPSEAGTKIDPLATIEADYPELQKHDNVLRLLKNGWYVKHSGKSDLIKDLKGMKYITFLLEKPDAKFDPITLEILVDGQTEHDESCSNMSPDQLEKEGLSLDELYIENMTKEEIKGHKDALQRLYDLSTSGDEKDIKQWKEYKQFIEDEFGLFFHETKKGLRYIYRARLRADADQKRKNISRAISTALSHIEASNCNDLAKFLSDKARLHTGNYFCYKSDAKTNWFIQK